MADSKDTHVEAALKSIRKPSAKPSGGTSTSVKDDENKTAKSWTDVAREAALKPHH